MKMLKEFNQYLSNLSVWIVKLHNIHWNVVGEQFVAVHEFTEAEYDKAFERMDAVAEHMKMHGHFPASTLKEHLELATIKEEPTRAFSCKEGLELVLADMEQMRKEAIALRHACDEEDWFAAVAMFEEHIADYNKQIWFINSMLSK
ncbi:Dps family protein [Filifactor villosus]|uniref:DNA starvation/stationary phase protection protein n=1 Tax=Filifactor villosus TaxID=29374 RepID=A0ABV9QL13_9FIRM